MKYRYVWIIAKLLIVLVNTFGLVEISRSSSEFGILEGSLCGVIFSPVLFLWIKMNSVGMERLWCVDEPFWPMKKHPQTYWLTIGVSLLIGSLLALVVGIVRPVSMNFSSGILMLSIGIILAVICAHRSLRDSRR